MGMVRKLALLALTVSLTLTWCQQACADDATDRQDPRWWFRHASAAVEQIKDAEGKHLVGGIVRDAQGKLLSPAQAAAAVDEQLATLRTKTGADATWQYEVQAARLLLAAGRQREALDSLKRAQAVITARFEGKPREQLLESLDWELDQFVSDAVKSGEFAMANEAASLHSRASFRAMRLGEVSVALAKAGKVSESLALVDGITVMHHRDQTIEAIAAVVAITDQPAAEKLLQQVSEAAYPQAWRKFLIHRCASDKQQDWNRAITQLMADAPKLEPRALEVCLGEMMRQLEQAKEKPTLAAEVSTEFETFLQSTISTNKRVSSEAACCLAEYHFACKRYPDAIATLSAGDYGHSLGVYQQKIALALLKAGQADEAFAYCRAMKGFEPSFELIEAFLKAKHPHEALYLAKQIDNIDHAFFPLGKIADDYATQGDSDGIAKVVEALDANDLRVCCLASAAQAAHKAKHQQLAEDLSAQGAKLLSQLPADERQANAARQLTSAYFAIGNSAAANGLAEKYMSGSDRVASYLSVANRCLEAKDEAGFLAAMREFEKYLTPEQLRASITAATPVEPRRRPKPGEPLLPPIFDPPAPMRPAEAETSDATDQEVAMSRMQLAFFGAQLYCRAGMPKEAQALLRRQFADAEAHGGVFWRVEFYAESISKTKTEAEFTTLAQLAETMPSPADKAILYVLGGAMLAHQQSGAAAK